MIVVCGGMQKSGSGWVYNMVNDMLAKVCGKDARTLRDEFQLDFLLHDNCAFQSLDTAMIERLLAVTAGGYSIAIKTHERPNPAMIELLADGQAKAVYSFRDPRDVVVSALDHGDKIRAKGETGTFALLENAEQAISAAARWAKKAKVWQDSPGTRCIRYEDLLDDTRGVMGNVLEFLNLPLGEAELDSVIQEYQPEQIAGPKTWRLHFNKGVTGRFRERLTAKEQQLCLEQFGDFLRNNNYDLS